MSLVATTVPAQGPNAALLQCPIAIEAGAWLRRAQIEQCRGFHRGEETARFRMNVDIAVDPLGIDAHERVCATDRAGHQTVGLGEVEVQWRMRPWAGDTRLAVAVLLKVPSFRGDRLVAGQHTPQKSWSRQKAQLVLVELKSLVDLELFSVDQRLVLPPALRRRRRVVRPIPEIDDVLLAGKRLYDGDRRIALGRRRMGSLSPSLALGDRSCPKAQPPNSPAGGFRIGVCGGARANKKEEDDDPPPLLVRRELEPVLQTELNAPRLISPIDSACRRS